VLRGIARDKADALPAEPARQDDAPGGSATIGRRLWNREGAILAAHRVEPLLISRVRPGVASFGGISLRPARSVLERLPRRLADLPYGDGEWWVQDAAASLRPLLAMLPAGVSSISAPRSAARAQLCWPAPR
jgi:hypothetical protein